MIALAGIIQLKDEEFQCLKKIVYDNIGVNLTESKRSLVVSRLTRRLRELEIHSFGDYCSYLEETPEEMNILANLITTNVTKFFREEHHFNFLKSTVLPQIKEDGEAGRRRTRVKAWSAGCSTGEEPYTIAVVLDDFFQDSKKWDFRILASDINTEVLRTAARGIYDREKVKGMPYHLVTRYFSLGTGANRGLLKVKDVLRRKLIFKVINLTRDEDYPDVNNIDFIFCRNVFIYFDRQSQDYILHKFAERVAPGGYLFLGHSETISADSIGARYWQLVRHTVYRRK